MTDQIFIHGLQAQTRIGVHDWEQAQKQSIVIDLELETDLAPSAASDDLAQTIDYAELSQRLLDYCAVTRHLLIERLAESLCGIVLTEFGAKAVRLRLHKPGAVPQARDLGVVIYRRA